MKKKLVILKVLNRIRSVMKYETLWQALEASKKEAFKQGIQVQLPMVTGGVSYGSILRLHLEPINKPRSRKCWQVVIQRMECGRYELVNYFL